MVATPSSVNDASPRQEVIVMTHTFPTLSQTFVLDQIEGLLSAGLDVRVVAHLRDKGGHLHEKGRRLASIATFAEDYVPLRRLLPRSLRCGIARLLQRRVYRTALRDADLVICHFGPVANRAALAIQKAKRPLLWTIFHGYDVSSYIERNGVNVYDGLFDRSDRLFCVSKFWKERFAALGCEPARVEVLRMGIDVDRMKFQSNSYDPERGLRILTTCRLIEKKGVEYTLRALAELDAKRPDIDWNYDVIGEGPLRKSLERLCEDLGISEKVSFLGQLSADDVHKRLNRSDIFVLSSVTANDGDMEGIPVSLMEAMAAGIPVLSTYHSGIPELIEHKVSGLLAPEKDYLSIFQNILLLVDNPRLFRSMAVAARNKIESDFNQRKILNWLTSEVKMALSATNAVDPKAGDQLAGR